MHPRNKHLTRYDLESLSNRVPELRPFITKNPSGDETIDFSNPTAVKLLNKALLLENFHLKYWDLPEEFLCPPVPGRADYIHHAADLFANPERLKVLDIGTGANCIYPLIGVKEYDWTFVGSDINKTALKNAEQIVLKNDLQSRIKLRHQRDKTKTFTYVIKPGELFDLTICNPPFHESLEEAAKGTERKWNNLGKNAPKDHLNFGGKGAELWCPGGEKKFIATMIEESELYKDQVIWFTTLVSKASNLPTLTKKIQSKKVTYKVIEMSQGQKLSRLLCWTYKT